MYTINEESYMKIGKHTIVFENAPAIISTGSAVGPKEKEGPLGSYFDTSVEDVYFGEKTFEKAESKFMGEAIDIAIKKNCLGRALECTIEQEIYDELRKLVSE